MTEIFKFSVLHKCKPLNSNVVLNSYILDYDSGICYEYDDIATERFGESLVMSYKYSPAPYYGIDTIYAKGEGKLNRGI